jgi:hypothetical protein
MKQKYRITSDSAIDNTFTVHLPDKKVKFVEIPNGLHIHVPSNKVDQQVQMLQSISENAVNNNPVTTHDVEMAEKIFGPDISALKGKTIRKKPIPVVDDVIDIPRELIASQCAIRLCVDKMNCK